MSDQTAVHDYIADIGRSNPAGCHPQEIAEHLGLSRRQVRRRLNALAYSGKAHRTAVGGWAPGADLSYADRLERVLVEIRKAAREQDAEAALERLTSSPPLRTGIPGNC